MVNNKEALNGLQFVLGHSTNPQSPDPKADTRVVPASSIDSRVSTTAAVALGTVNSYKVIGLASTMDRQYYLI